MDNDTHKLQNRRCPYKGEEWAWEGVQNSIQLYLVLKQVDKISAFITSLKLVPMFAVLLFILSVC